MTLERSYEILNELKKIIPNPKCELNYSSVFELLCAVILSSQTTDKRVNEVTPALFSKYPTPLDLSMAQPQDVYSIIQSLGFAKTKSINLIEMAKTLHFEFHDVVPNTLEELQRLNGVGRKTASVILAEGYKIPAMPVDTHLVRMAKRFGYISEEGSVKEAEESFRTFIKEEDWIISHHLFLLFGRYHCKAIKPQCESCRVKQYCKKEH